MKRVFILSFLFLSFLAFGQTNNSSEPENLLAGSNIITADLTRVQAGEATVTETAAANSILKIFLGVGFDLLIGTDIGTEKPNQTSDSYLFIEDPSIQGFHEIPFIGTTNFIVGTRLFELLDVFGRVGMSYGYTLREEANSSYSFLGNLGLSVDANVRGNFFLTDTFGLYAHAGIGLDYNFKEFTGSFSFDDSSYTSSSSFSSSSPQKSQKDRKQFFATASLGLTFRVGKTDGLNIGYTLRYYLPSSGSTADYRYTDHYGGGRDHYGGGRDHYGHGSGSSGGSATQSGNHQIAHGISFEYLFFL